VKQAKNFNDAFIPVPDTKYHDVPALASAAVDVEGEEPGQNVIANPDPRNVRSVE
jgi:hypothetical protein